MKRFAISLLFVLCALSSSTFAQTSRSLQEIVNDTIAFQQAIAVSEIVSYEQETQTFLTNIQNGINDRNNLEEVEVGFNEIDSLTSVKSPVSKESLISSGPIALQNQVSEWTTYRERLTNWNEDLRERVSWFEAQQVSTANLKTLWQETRVAAAEADAPSEVLLRIRTLIRSIGQVEKQLSSSRNLILQKDVEIADMLTVINGDLATMNEVKDESVKSLVIIESPPLWKFLVIKEEKEAEGESLASRIKTIISNRISTISSFYNNNKLSFLFGFLSLLAFYLIALYLKKKSTEWYEAYKTKRLKDPVKSTTELILKDRLISVSVLLGLLLISILFPIRPVVLDEILVLLAIIPLVRVINAFSREKFSITDFFAILFFIGHVNVLFVELQLLNRVVLLLISLALGLFLILGIRRNVIDKIAGGFVHFLLSIFVWLGLAAQIVAVVSNTLGNVTLANYLVYGFLDLYFITILLYAVTTIFINLSYIVMRSPALQGLFMVQKHEVSILQRTKSILVILAILYWLEIATDILNVQNALVESVSGFLMAPIPLGSFSFSFGDILIFFLVVWISIIISKSVRFLLDEEIFPRTKTKRGTSATITTFVRVTIVTLGFVLAIGASGFPLDQLTILLGAFGVGIGFGLQNIFNNLVSGFIIATERPMEVGDTIEVGTLIGEVREVGIRSSVVRTYDGAEVIVPNGNIISNELINWTHSDQQRRLKIPVGVAYGTDVHKVFEILNKVGESDNRILNSPSSYVLFKGFGESSLDFELRCWTSSDDWFILESDLAVKVHDALKEESISIPFPQRDLHLRSVDKDFLEKTKESINPKKKS